jgi:hypothetical protein
MRGGTRIWSSALLLDRMDIAEMLREPLLKGVGNRGPQSGSAGISPAA